MEHNVLDIQNEYRNINPNLIDAASLKFYKEKSRKNSLAHLSLLRRYYRGIWSLPSDQNAFKEQRKKILRRCRRHWHVVNGVDYNLQMGRAPHPDVFNRIKESYDRIKEAHIELQDVLETTGQYLNALDTNANNLAAMEAGYGQSFSIPNMTLFYN